MQHAPEQTGAAHTPGPWIAEPADIFGDHNIVTGDQLDCLAIAAVVSNMRPAAVVAANALLTAAAPDLLEVAIDLLAPLERAAKELQARGKVLDDNAQASFDRARAAIAKATSK